MLSFEKKLMDMNLEDLFEQLSQAVQRDPGSLRAALETTYQRGKWEVLVDWTETVNERILTAPKGQ